MNQIISANIKESFSTLTDQFIQKSREWGSRAVSYLQDPRIASATLFVGNFLIIEVAILAGRLIGSLFPDDTPSKRNLKLIIVTPIQLGIIAAANYGVVRAAGINLHPVVIAAVATVSIAVRWQAQKCLE